MSPLVPGPVTVSVPATSANLGPGFDSLGLALGLRDTLTAEAYDGSLQIHVEGEGAGEVPLTHEHLVHVAMSAGFDAMGVATPGIVLHCHNVVPHARGLGSSSAAIVAGILLARGLVEDGEQRLDDLAVLALASRLEGHPDNVAPALLGGFTIAVARDPALGPQIDVARLKVDQRIGAIVMVPPDAVATSVARGLLPVSVPHQEAAANAGRAALLVAALGGRLDLLLPATRDLLHQEHRRPAMPATLDLVDRLREDGIAAVVSGAGPTVLSFVARADAEALRVRTPAGWSSHVPDVGVDGAQVTRS